MIYVFLGFRVLSVIYACYIWRSEIEEEVELKGEREREKEIKKLAGSGKQADSVWPNGLWVP